MATTTGCVLNQQAQRGRQRGERRRGGGEVKQVKKRKRKRAGLWRIQRDTERGRQTVRAYRLKCKLLCIRLLSA